jgi:large subunit ribosomal protein L1
VAKHGKKYRQAVEKVELRPYPLEDAIRLAKDASYVKFDETLEVAMRLGVDPKHADQMVRGTVVLPHGLGKTSRVLVFASGEKIREAEEAGADHVGGDDIAKKIEGGWLDFDAVVATPDMMRVVGRLGKVLGPRGLMPNPKAGTVTTDVARAVQEIKAGKVEFRVDKTGIIHAPVGKLSFGPESLTENAAALIGAVMKAKPAAAKGKYVRGVSISSTMGPGIKVDETHLTTAEA